LIVPLASATVLQRQVSSAESIYKFNSTGSSIENIAVRPNGQLLVTRFDAPEVWSVDPVTKVATKIFTLPGVTCAAGITEIESEPDTFAIVGGNYSAAGGNTAGSWGIFKLEMSNNQPIYLGVKYVPESVMFNGLTTFARGIVLIADGKGLVYRMEMTTGEYGIAAQHVSMEPPTWAPIPLGIDGLRYFNGSIYFTNIFGKTFSKMAVDKTGKGVGGVTTLWNSTQADDFAIGADGSAYVATNSNLGVVKFTPDGKMSNVSSIAGSTSCAFGRNEKDKNILYITAGSSIVSTIV
jgi:hypothetical protein